MDFVLKNFAAITNLLSIIAVLFGAIFALVKWIDERKQKLRNDRYEQYVELVRLISGAQKDISVLEQCAGVWLLLEYKEYHAITLNIFSEEMISRIQGNASELLKSQIKQVINKIRQLS